MAAKDEENPLFVDIKSEYIECNVDVKIEPPDEPDSPDPDYIPEIENVTVKIEPSYYESDEEPHAKPSSYRPVKTSYKPSPRKYKRRTQSESDEDYAPKKKKKKMKEHVKKTYTTKAKKQENLYSEDVTKHIEVVTITEEERLEEFRECWQSRQHMRHTCRHCALGFVLENAYVMHMKSHSPEAGSHVCDICHCRSKSADILYRHRLRHHRRYRCTRCRKLHKDKETAASHVMTYHTRLAFTCPHCGKGFKRPAYLKKHVAQQHVKSERHSCPAPDCGRVFHDKAALRSHHSRHPTSAASTFGVHSLSTDGALTTSGPQRISERHNDETHRVVEQPVICDTCSRKFPSKGHLRRHIVVHQTERGLPCPHCGAEYTTERGLRLHISNQHSGRARSVTASCQQPEAGLIILVICGRVESEASAQQVRCERITISSRARNDFVACDFNSPANLKCDKTLRHAAHAQCPSCARTCTTPALLRLHIRRMHSDRTKKYQCDECKRWYYSKGEVRAHIQWSHSRSRAPAHACRCGQVFRTRTRLRVTTTNLLQGPIFFNLCNFLGQRINLAIQSGNAASIFGTSPESLSNIFHARLKYGTSYLGHCFRTNHINLHHLKIEPERTHFCHCGKAFSSKSVLARHMKSHDGLTYPCPECGLRFKSEPYVKVHHQLKHLNMTRAEIKALKKPREREKKKIKEAEISEDVMFEQDKLSVPLFDFVELKMEID
ncbi:hypothetical protein MSG28_011600 [Choristoneura fumiferana]|uniref:Uncharacterized protein n=1 Tax=Choristoneura fumiferana TaxID=7141 RepID=A0ACC0JP42_CHOFU|nr:hypothetical protein MSG28_011600 [Choristoneura fumiferana]